MALINEFEYVRPRTLKQAVQALARDPGAQVLAGGTDLIPWMRDGLASPTKLVDIKGIRGLNRIRVRSGRLVLGCLVTFSQVLQCDRVRKKAPLLWEMAGQVASVGIRNRATLVGNLCSAVPCTDAGTCLLVYEASVHLVGPAGERAVPLEEWFLGPRRTAGQLGEVATAVSFELPPPASGGAWAKLGRYRGEDLAQASVAVLVLPENRYRIAFGAVAPRPLRARALEEQLAGQPLSERLVDMALAAVPETISPITDVRATKEYRAEMVKVMLRRCLEAAVARMSGQGPAYGERLI